MTSYPMTREQFILWRDAGLSRAAIARKIGKDTRSVRRWMIRQGFANPPKSKPLPLSQIHKCQYIAGDPSADDRCKCLQPAALGKPYCPEHYYKCVIYGSSRL